MQLSVGTTWRSSAATSRPGERAARGPSALTQLFKPGTEIFSPGTEIAALSQITRGWAFAASTLADGRRQILNFLLPGDLLPLECIFQSTVQGFYQALTEVSAVGLPLKVLRNLVDSDAAFASAILRQQAMQISVVNEHLVNAGRRSAYERVVHLLLEFWHRMAPSQEPASETFHLPFTQEVLADALGLSVIHVNRTLQRIRADGLFEIHAGAPMRVRVVDPSAAMHVAGFDVAYLRGI
jgi:CRP-like cAMP-binding protein